MNEMFALLRMMLELVITPVRPIVPAWGCCGPWQRLVILILIFVVVVSAMVILTISGVSLVAASAVVVACGVLTAGVAVRLIGPGPETA